MTDTTLASANAESAPSLLRLAPLVAIVFCGSLTIGIPLPALPRYVHEALGYGPVVVGWAVGLQSLVTVATRGLAGTLCDARGPKTGVLLGLPAAILAGLAYLVSASLASAPAVSLAILLAGRAVLGLAESLFLTGAMAWGIARVGPRHTGRVMAWQGIAMYGALGFGAPVGLALQQAIGFKAVALAGVGLPLIGIAVALSMPKPEHPGVAREGSFLRVLGLIWSFGLAQALATAPFAAMAAFLALDFAARGWSGAGLALAGFAAGYIGVRLFLAHLPDRVGGSRVAVISMAIEAVGQLILWSAGSEPIAMLGALVTGIGFSLVFPSLGVQATRRVSAENRGLAVAGFMMFFDVALGITGPAAGLVAARFGYAAVFLVGALAAVAGIAMVGAARDRSAP